MATKHIEINGRTGPEDNTPGDKVDALICQLDAATAMICGEGFKEFQNMNDDIQENYLWLLHDLAARARFAQQEEIEARAEARVASEGASA